MFSQWRHAVENLTQHSPKPSQDGMEDNSTRGSTDSNVATPSSSSSQLADSALSNLRKSLAQQRPASPSIKKSASTDSTTQAVSPASRSRTTLEDRLRAKFAAGEGSAGSTPSTSTKNSPSSTPVQVVDHPLSPAPPQTEPTNTAHSVPLSPKSTPLPDSPTIEPSVIAPIPLSAIVAEPLSSTVEDESTVTDAANEGSKDEVILEGAEGETTKENNGAENEEQRAAGGQDDTAKEATPERSTSALPQVQEPHTDNKTSNFVSESTLYDAEAEDVVPGSVAAEVVETTESGNTSGSPIQAKTDIVDNQDNVAGINDLEELPEAKPVAEAVAASERPADTNSSEGDIVASSAEVDVEALQKRLKLVEQRFTGTFSPNIWYDMVCNAKCRCINILQTTASREGSC
jgi:hypothetical protein